MKKKIILIGGPTASGKSGLALKIAGAFDGAIINADSMQVYRELRTLTARPTIADETEAPHHLYGHLAGSAPCSVAVWLAAAREKIDVSWAENKTPIVTGGTGLYFKALLEGLAAVPEISENVREEVRRQLEKDGASSLHQQLNKLDPEMAARLEPGDSQRVTRALEVILSTGRSLRDWQAEQPEGGLNREMAPNSILSFAFLPDRETLYERCNARLRQMVEVEDAIDEVRHLLSLNYAPHLPVMKALGVPQIALYLRNEQSLEEAIQQTQTATRQYAKRQMTWFRNQFNDWDALNEQLSESLLNKIFCKIKNFVLTT